MTNEPKELLLLSLRWTLLAFFVMLGFVAVAAISEMLIPLAILGGILLIGLLFIKRPTG